MCKSCNSTQNLREIVFFQENLHSWHKIYTTTGRDCRDKSQLWTEELSLSWFVKIKLCLWALSALYMTLSYSGGKRIGNDNQFSKSFNDELCQVHCTRLTLGSPIAWTWLLLGLDSRTCRKMTTRGCDGNELVHILVWWFIKYTVLLL